MKREQQNQGDEMDLRATYAHPRTHPRTHHTHGRALSLEVGLIKYFHLTDEINKYLVVPCLVRTVFYLNIATAD